MLLFAAVDVALLFVDEVAFKAVNAAALVVLGVMVADRDVEFVLVSAAGMMMMMIRDKDSNLWDPVSKNYFPP